MPQPLLNGRVDPEYVNDSTTRDLAAEIDGLESRVAMLESMLATVDKRAVVALLNLLSSAMRDIAAGKYNLTEVPSTTASPAKWDAVKQRLAPRLRECIDLLLVQGHMKRTQIAAALKMDYSNCIKNVIQVLQRQGLLVENGGELSLKEL